MTRLPASLRLHLSAFLDMEGSTRNALEDSSFDLTFFLAEALLGADINDRASERAGHYDFPGLACMFERLDEHLDHHSTASEVRQAKGGELLQWFDAP